MTAPTAVRERPILFSAEMVRAILDERKTQTRRVITRRQRDEGEWVTTRPGENYTPDLIAREFPAPWRVGDHLWVRETWQAWTEFDDTRPCDLPTIARTHINYPANGSDWDSRRRPSIHMPRWASRITLELTDVRIERVRSITEADAKAEGVEPKPCVSAGCSCEHIHAFRSVWDALNRNRGYGYDTNPWVWVLTFRRVTP